MRPRWRAIVPLLLGAAIRLIPVPSGLTASAWSYFALFVTVIAALITEPIPGPVVGLLGITAAAALLLVAPTPDDSIRWALSGFSNGTVWLIFVAFMFGLGYEKTGLGRRIALSLVRSLGRDGTGADLLRERVHHPEGVLDPRVRLWRDLPAVAPGRRGALPPRREPVARSGSAPVPHSERHSRGLSMPRSRILRASARSLSAGPARGPRP